MAPVNIKAYYLMFWKSYKYLKYLFFLKANKLYS